MTEHDEHDEHDESRRADTLRSRAVVGVLLLALGIGTAVESIIVGNRVEQLQHCQSQYATRFNAALDERGKISDDSRRALDELVTKISRNPSDQSATKAALRDYLAARRQADRQRAHNPLPQPPAETCRG